MPLISVRGLIGNFRNNDSFISMEQFARSLGFVPPFSLQKIIQGQGTGTIRPQGQGTGTIRPQWQGVRPIPDSVVDLPEFIELSSGTELIVRFSGAIERIIIPGGWLPEIITDYDTGDQFFPDNFCGFRIVGASGFLWSDFDNRILEFPFGRLPDDDRNFVTLEFTGPIGKCRHGGAPDFFFSIPLIFGGGYLPSGILREFSLIIQGAAYAEFLLEAEIVQPMKTWYSPEKQNILKNFVELLPGFFADKFAVKELKRRGWSNADIANHLGIGERDVEDFLR